jgi:hypothetical protein
VERNVGPRGKTHREHLVASGWRKRMGIEPTPRTVSVRGNGFEDRESHQAPCASARECTIAVS